MNREFTTTIRVAQSPQHVFEAVTNVRGWWSGEIDGPTDELGGAFTYRYKDLHYSKQTITELVPGRRVAWRVTDSYLGFVADEREWNGTTIAFDIAAHGETTELRFTHAGLVPAHECYGACASAWSSYIQGSLRSLIETGVGEPNAREHS